jgi:N-acetylneuraminic acid mutarotase
MSFWSPSTSILNAHDMMGAAVIGIPVWPTFATLNLYVVGGSGDSGDVEIQTNFYLALRLRKPLEWNAGASLLTPRLGHAVCVGSDNRIYAIGGRSNPGEALLSGVEGYTRYYPPKPGFWSVAKSMRTARERAAAAQGHDGVIYVAGGSNGSTLGEVSPLNTLEAYHASTGKWKTLANMLTARDGAAAVTGTDGRIYVIGGRSGAIGSLSTVEAYDIATNAWAEVSSMTTPRDGLGAVLGTDGQIYAIGGENSGEALSSVEVYNFATATWTPGPSMSTARYYFAAANGPDGGIYAIGGQTALAGPTNSVEVLFV